MRTGAEVIAEQKKDSYNPVWKVVLTQGATTYTYDASRILRIEHAEEPFSHKATIFLDNSDLIFTSRQLPQTLPVVLDTDLKGFKAVISYGFTIAGVDFFSPCAPLWVVMQRLDSSQSKLACALECIGMPNFLAEDRAQFLFMPTEYDTRTVKTLINEMMSGTASNTFASYTVWATATPYVKGDLRRRNDSTEYLYECAVAGTSGGFYPSWADEVGSVVTDGTVKWECVGAPLVSYSHCPTYTVVWGTEDSLIDNYIPKDGFRIYKDSSRLAALRRLLDWTKCVARFRDDGSIYIFSPTTSGAVFDYEYSLAEGAHTFFSKVYQKKLCLPNKIVVSSRGDDAVKYSGEASDMGSYAALGFYQTQFEETFLISDAQATAIAESILYKYQMWAEVGSLFVPMNVVQELYDYIKVTDIRSGDFRIGNIGKLTRTVDLTKKYAEWSMTFSFGGWLSVRDQLNNLELYPSGFGNAGQYFSRLSVKDMYVENLLAGNMAFSWLDPDNTIDLSLSGSNLDELANGTTYARVKSVALSAAGMVLLDALIDGTYAKILQTQIQAGKIYLSEAVTYKAGYDPSNKRRVFTTTPTTPYDVGDLWLDASVIKRCTTARATGDYVAGDWTATTLDAIAEGTTYQKLLATDISAGHIKLTSETVVAGEWYKESGVAIDAVKGIGIYGGTGLSGLRTYPTEANYLADKNVQCYVGTDGKINAGAGAVQLSADGINLSDTAKATGIGFAKYFYEGISYAQAIDSIAAWFIDAGGGAGSAQVIASGQLWVRSGSTLNNTLRLERRLPFTPVTPSWDKNRRFKTKVLFESATLQDIFIGMGNAVVGGGTGRHAGFRILNESIYATVANGTTETAVDTGVDIVAATSYLLECVNLAGVNAKFYVEGIEKATITTTLPSGTTDAQRIIVLMPSTTEGGVSKDIDLSTFNFLQEP